MLRSASVVDLAILLFRIIVTLVASEASGSHNNG